MALNSILQAVLFGSSPSMRGTPGINGDLPNPNMSPGWIPKYLDLGTMTMKPTSEYPGNFAGGGVGNASNGLAPMLNYEAGRPYEMSMPPKTTGNPSPNILQQYLDAITQSQQAQQGAYTMPNAQAPTGFERPGAEGLIHVAALLAQAIDKKKRAGTEMLGAYRQGVQQRQTAKYVTDQKRIDQERQAKIAQAQGDREIAGIKYEAGMSKQKMEFELQKLKDDREFDVEQARLTREFNAAKEAGNDAAAAKKALDLEGNQYFKEFTDYWKVAGQFNEQEAQAWKARRESLIEKGVDPRRLPEAPVNQATWQRNKDQAMIDYRKDMKKLAEEKFAFDKGATRQRLQIGWSNLRIQESLLANTLKTGNLAVAKTILSSYNSNAGKEIKLYEGKIRDLGIKIKGLTAKQSATMRPREADALNAEITRLTSEMSSYQELLNEAQEKVANTQSEAAMYGVQGVQQAMEQAEQMRGLKVTPSKGQPIKINGTTITVK